MKKGNLFKTSSVILTLLLALSAAGCGSDSSSSKSYDTANSEYALESSAEGGFYDYGADAPEAEEVSAEENVEVSESDAGSQKAKRKLITNISMNVETREFDTLITYLKNRTEELGGYVESENVNNNSYYSSNKRTSTMKLRIPEEKLDGFVNEVSEKSNITSQNRYVTDVTLQYADLESHKKALLTEQEQLLALMEKAETIDEILQIQTQLTDVRYQLESMESQLRTYDNQINYSTVDISIDEVIEYTPEDPVTFGERAKQGFLDNLEAVGNFFVNVILAFITHIPMLIVLAIIVIIIVFIVKATGKRNLKKREAQMKAMMQAQNPVTYNNAPASQNPSSTDSGQNQNKEN